MKLFIKEGGNINGFDENGQNPLKLTLEKGHHSVVRLLLQHGANPSISYVYKVGNRQFHGNAISHAEAIGVRSEIIKLLEKKAAVLLQLDDTSFDETLTTMQM